MNKKKITISAITLIAIGAVAWSLFGTGKKYNVTYETAKVEKGSISNSVTATGTVEPVTQVEVGTQVSGIINKLYADYNSVVTKGQLIAELDKENLQNELASKKSNMANAKSEYEYQLKVYIRQKKLHEKELISENEYDTALYNYEKAKNTYDMSKNEYAKAETNLGYATIYSPIDGVVLSRAVEEGQTVNAGMTTPTLFTIANDLTDMQVIANVDEADIGEVNEEQRVLFTVDAYPHDTFEGMVKQVRQEATVTSNVVTYEVVISAPNPSLKLKPGLTANITIYTLEKNNILCIPAKALRFIPNQAIIGSEDEIQDCEGTTKLWTREGKTFKAHAVTTGITNGILTEIVSGINEATTVITDMNVGQTPAKNGFTTESNPFAPTPPGKNRK